MVTNLYVTFDRLRSAADLSEFVAAISVPGYSFSIEPQKKTIHIPNEGDFPVTCQLYAQNYFRIYISHAAMEFYRGADIPPDLAAGETLLYKRILETNEFSVRRWLVTSEGWDDDDEPFVNVVAEGTAANTFPLLSA